jgi:hypothetical protein
LPFAIVAGVDAGRGATGVSRNGGVNDAVSLAGLEEQPDNRAAAPRTSSTSAPARRT